MNGRPVVVTGGPVAGLVGLARAVQLLGATRVFLLGSEGQGSGSLPEPEDGEWLALDVSASTMVDGIRAGHRLLADLPEHARQAIERFDPDHEALVVATFLNELPEVAGRPCLAFRRPEWVALEDKVVIDEFWDRVGVARAPSDIVPAERSALNRAARDLDQGAGTVWAADARDGWHGGAEGLRWLRNHHHIEEAFAFFSARADRVRVMTFLEGVPCSIHGLVFDDYEAALRPVEIVTLRSHETSGFFYAGVASFWDPDRDDREEMRAVARRVGARLRAEVDFRGPFTVDGVMTTDGFRPTELNPRGGAGLQTLVATLPSMPVGILVDAIAAGLDLDFCPAQLEDLIVSQADAIRAGGTWRAVSGDAPEVLGRPVAGGAAGYRWAEDDDPADGWVIAGPSPLGAFVRLTLNSSRTPVGPSIAPRAVAFYRFADSHLGTRVGRLDAARQVR